MEAKEFEDEPEDDENEPDTEEDDLEIYENADVYGLEQEEFEETTIIEE